MAVTIIVVDWFLIVAHQPWRRRKAAPICSYRPEHVGPAGAGEQGTFMRVPQEPGRSNHLHEANTGGVPLINTQSPSEVAPAPGGCEEVAQRGTAK